jgi:Zn-dependent M28 family amino/carboxypeptidase
MQKDVDAAAVLQHDVEQLAGRIGPRNVYHPAALAEAASFIERSFRELGCTVSPLTYEARGQQFVNIQAELRGTSRPEELVIVGAHYDTHRDSPGANDNASGVAASLALARHFIVERPARTLRFVAFTNEERPFLRTRRMGSRVYAEGCRRRGEKIIAMLSLETIGYCSTRKGSQRLSLFGLVAPRTADFVAIVGNRKSKELLKRVTNAFGRSRATVGCRSYVLPEHAPGGWSSDHWSFWKSGYAAVMVTDTAPLRYRHYHRKSDTPERLEYPFLASVVSGLKGVVGELVSG